MSRRNRTAYEEYAQAARLGEERRLIERARAVIAEHDDTLFGLAEQVGRLEYYVTELAAALELRHRQDKPGG